MNGLIFCAFVCAIFVFVRSEDDNDNDNENDLPVCRLLGTDLENLSTLADCVVNHFPKVAIDIIDECHREVVGETGSISELLKMLCAEEKDETKLDGMERCMNEKGELVDDLEEEDMVKASEDAEWCYLEKVNILNEVLDLDEEANQDQDQDQDQVSREK